MKRKNIYKMCMWFSLLFAVFPLLSLILANIFWYMGGCGLVTSIDVVSDCYSSWMLHSLFLLSVYWVITLPIGVLLWGVFWWMYRTANK